MATTSDTENMSPASNVSAPTPRENQPSVERQPLPKPKKQTEQDLINSVARYQAEAERREREEALAARGNGPSNGTNGHHSNDKPPKVDKIDAPRQ